MKTIPCLRCSDTIEIKPGRGRKPKHCQSCARDINTEKQRERDRAIRADQQFIREVAENLRPYLDPSMYVTVEQYIEALGVPTTASKLPIGHDQQPTGAMSDGGSEDGVSTYFTDLAEELEAHRMKVIMHDWFKENPRWADGLTGGDPN